MSSTLLSSLSSTLKLSTREEIASTLGESEPAVSRGFNLATAAVFDGLSRQADDSDGMRKVIDMASKAPAEVPWAVSAGQLSDPNSPLVSGGKKLLRSLLGNREDAIANAVSRESGLRGSSASTVLTFAAQSVLTFLGVRVRNQGMTATALSDFLRRETSDLQDALPVGFHNDFMAPSANVAARSPVIAQEIETDPVIAQTVRKQRSFLLLWLLPLLLLVLALILWSLFRSQPPPAAETPVPAAAIPPESAAPPLGSLIPRQLANGSTLNIPERGVEGRLLAFIQNPALQPDKTSWFDFDRLLFSTGSATLQPQSMEQLHNVAAILAAYPAVRMTIGGYTDNTGDAAKNLQLSQDRADNVTAELEHLGVARDRLVAKGYGDQHPVADNSTETGRAQNRRISMLVTRK